MKILRIVRTLDPKQGGVSTAVEQCAAVFNQGAHGMEVLCLDDENSTWINNTKSFKIHALGKARTHYGFSYKYLIWLWRNCRNYDVVIIDGLWQFIVFGAYVLKFFGVPYCIFVHGMLDPYFNKNKLKYIKKLPFWFLIERQAISNAHATLFTCEEEMCLAEKSFPFYRSNPKISSLGVFESRFNRESAVASFKEMFQEVSQSKFVLFLSRLDPKKGLDILIEAYSKSSLRRSGTKLVIAGPGENRYVDTLKSKAMKLGCSDDIFWLGMLSGEIKWGAYHASDVFILPSHQENFGIVVAEALSTGSPVLLTKKVNIWREIESVSAGFIETDDVKGILSLLESWSQIDVETENAMRANASYCFRKNFSMKSAIDNLEFILTDVAVKGAGNGK